MARGRKTSLTISLTPAQRETLRAWQRGPTIAAGRARRGRMIFLLADGLPISHIAAIVGSVAALSTSGYSGLCRKGLEGLADKPGRGRLPGASGSPAGAARLGA